MFGYLDVQKDKLEQGKLGLWQSFMCGLCASTKRQFGNIPRMYISNDINFFNVLFHSVMNADLETVTRRCVAHPFTKQTMLSETELMDRLAVANVLLTYWNLYDDVVDGATAKKKSALRLIKRSYGEAKTAFPQLDGMLSSRYAELRQMEESNCDSIDKIAHSFAQLAQDFAVLVLGECANQYLQTLCYNLGKWIYLVDALDDAPKDIKRRNYNPFVASYHATTVSQLSGNYDEIEFEMYAVLNRVAQCYNDLNLGKYTCILNNVVYDSIRNKTKAILDRYKAK